MKSNLTKKQAFWLGHVKAALLAKKSFVNYARQHNLVLKSLYSWKSKFCEMGLLSKNPSQAFVRVKESLSIFSVNPSVVKTTAEPVSVILPNGVCFKIPVLTKETLSMLFSQ